MTTGVIKFYAKDKGFGFLRANESGEEFFFSYKSLLYEPCLMDDKVTFIVIKSRQKPGKLEATEIQILE